jgi:hypothetical protein
MTADLWPLLDRDRYTDEEWELSSAGLCDVVTDDTYGTITRCGAPSSPASAYRWCDDHDRQARDDDPGAYGT